MEIKYLEDYMDEMLAEFPDVEKWEMEKILKHGLQAYYTVTCNGGDILIADKAHFKMFCGRLHTDAKLAWKYYNIKMKIKLRMKYAHKNPVWDGSYYFGLTEDEYAEYIPDKKGRIKNKITFEKITCHKILEEAALMRADMYFFKLTGEENHGFQCVLENFSTRNIQLVAVRDKNGKLQSIDG